MSPDDYQFLCQFLMDRSGLSLGQGKEYLLNSRLTAIAHSWGAETLEELVHLVRGRQHPQLETAVVEAMTTNESLFFRDQTPFDEAKDRLLPQLIQARQSRRTLRIWSAACSTGQEAYSLLMLLDETFPELASWSVEVLATDLSENALSKAKAGIYSQFEIQRGLPIQLLIKYFTQVPQGWQVKEELRQRVSWKKWNLLDPFLHFGQFDLIFCRNVLIYFDKPTKQEVLNRIAGVCAPDGYLVLGASETMLGLNVPFASEPGAVTSIYLPQAESSESLIARSTL